MHFEQLAAGSVIVLHACCHNPTGQDLSPEQWAAVADVLARRRLLPFLDMAYQGLGEDLDRDAASIRLMAKAVPEMLVAVSCSKNFGLYRERTGLIAVLNAGHEAASSRPASSVVSREPSGRCRRITGPLLWIACCRRRSYAKTG